MKQRIPLSERIGKLPPAKVIPAKTNNVEPDKRLIELLTRNMRGVDFVTTEQEKTNERIFR